jgi:mannosyltransferase OCH1-like enzyme
MADIIQSMWVGSRLSVMEQMCIASFLDHGHPFHLYAYEPIDGVPDGTVLKDANEILPASSIFMYTEYASYAGFSNFFRYKLLLERGGWWVDTDLLCIRPFDFAAPYVFSSEQGGDGPRVNVGAIKSPPGSRVMQYAWDACVATDTKELKWGQIGPRLAAAAVEACSLQQYVRPPHVFCPLHFTDRIRMLDPAATWNFSDETYGIHMWNELWRRDNQSKDASYHEGCLYEALKRRYLRSYKNDVLVKNSTNSSAAFT